MSERRGISVRFVCLVLGAVSIGGCHTGQREAEPASGAAPLITHSGEVRSNVLRADYAGSEACSGCHEREYAAWRDSPMHRMTRDLRKTQISAPFSSNTFAFRSDSVRLEQIEGQRFMRLHESSAQRDSLFRVTKVIGGRYREDFVGFEVDPESPLAAARDVERILPVSYLVFNGEWRYKGYSVMVRERPALEPGVVWKTGCIFCHNTTPTLSLLLDDIYGEYGQRAHSYQGSASVELPDDKRPRYAVSDETRLKRALSAELSYLGNTRDIASYGLKRALTVSIDGTRDSFDERHLVELGIGCEACHGGSREHTQNPGTVKPSLSLRSDFLRATTAAGGEPSHAEDVNRTCAKCHTVLFSRYPYTWEGRTRKHDPGGATINSGEARDFLLGGCNKQLSCVHCHDPHGEDPKRALLELESSKGDALCASCHEKYRGSEAQRAHTHHADGSAGSHCLNCHMPKKNLGLAYELTRYHRVGSPTDRERVEGDRPLECALCHTDKSVDQLVSTMERFWRKRYDRDALRRLYGGDLRVNALEATLRYGKPHEQGTAVAIAGRDRRRDLLPLVTEQLANEYPLVRYFARHAIERITDSPLPIDMNATGADVLKSAQVYLSAQANRNPAQ
ncbi:MAG TPA: cytochrome c3 family protein [Polyangiaceae bacterium]|nr:cytochrome c3 family protein [Polyangiaceae bacterium]